MHKDEAMDIAFNAKGMTVDELLTAYGKFHAVVENTPWWFGSGNDEAYAYGTQQDAKPHDWQRGLHGAIGLCTEAAEILDAHKKELYGKLRPLRPDNIREECGDVFFYLFLIMSAYGLDLRSILQDNVIKLANRYIEKLEV